MMLFFRMESESMQTIDLSHSTIEQLLFTQFNPHKVVSADLTVIEHIFFEQMKHKVRSWDLNKR